MEKLPEIGEQDDLNNGRGADNGAVVREHEKVIAVNSSISHGQVTAETLSSGALWLSTKVCGLFPGAAYTFRVAAMNVLGAGHWSHRSSRVVIAPRRRLTSLESGAKSQYLAVPTLKGVGDPGYSVVSGVDILSQSDLSALIAQDPHRILRATGVQVQDATLPRVVLSDVNEQVQLLSSNASEQGTVGVERSFEAWSSHYSPRLFDVSAELVLADLPDACSHCATLTPSAIECFWRCEAASPSCSSCTSRSVPVLWGSSSPTRMGCAAVASTRAACPAPTRGAEKVLQRRSGTHFGKRRRFPACWCCRTRPRSCSSGSEQLHLHSANGYILVCNARMPTKRRDPTM